VDKNNIIPNNKKTNKLKKNKIIFFIIV